MNNRFFLTLSVVLMLILKSAWSNNNDWQCAVNDNEGKHWEGKSNYARVATNKAFEACKKESRVPASCRPIKESCDYSGEDKKINTDWQCTALDQTASKWVSKNYHNKDDAALDAKTSCQEHSSIPESCYINLLTCKER